MIRVHHPYHVWEDWSAGMYADRWSDGSVAAAARLLSDPDECLAAMLAVVREWPNAAEHHLTNMARNRRAWVGQAACCWALGVSESVTKRAWWTMSEPAQALANAAADVAIAEWETERDNAQTLFGS